MYFNGYAKQYYTHMSRERTKRKSLNIKRTNLLKASKKLTYYVIYFITP